MNELRLMTFLFKVESQQYLVKNIVVYIDLTLYWKFQFFEFEILNFEFYWNKTQNNWTIFILNNVILINAVNRAQRKKRGPGPFQ